MKNFAKNRGFTLIELLLVIGIIAILAAIVIVAINPTKQLGDARDAQRRSDVNTLLNAIWQFAIDNQGAMPDDNGTTAGGVAVDNVIRMIGTATSGCSVASVCPDATPGATSCLNLTSALSTNYVVSVPIDPNGGPRNYNAASTGYAVSTTAGGRIKVVACDPEQDDGAGISVQR